MTQEQLKKLIDAISNASIFMQDVSLSYRMARPEGSETEIRAQNAVEQLRAAAECLERESTVIRMTEYLLSKMNREKEAVETRLQR